MRVGLGEYQCGTGGEKRSSGWEDERRRGRIVMCPILGVYPSPVVRLNNAGTTSDFPRSTIDPHKARVTPPIKSNMLWKSFVF